jgi:hypothetical protein
MARTSPAVAVPPPAKRLVEERGRVPRRPLGRAGDERQRPVLDPRALGLRDAAQEAHHHLGLDPAEVEALAAAQHRDGTLRISVVAKTNFTCGGGSSSVFRSALNALVESMWTSSMMKTL